MYSLLDVYQQAKEDSFSKTIVTESAVRYMAYGWRVVRERKSERVYIMNMTMGGEFYQEASEEDYATFLELGWKEAVYVLYLCNCRSKLDKLELRINKAIVNNERVVVIRKLKDSRDRILQNFNKVKFKLNQNEKTIRKISI